MLLGLNFSILVVLKPAIKSSPFFVTFRSIFQSHSQCIFRPSVHFLPRLVAMFHPFWSNYNLLLRSTQFLKSIFDLVDDLLNKVIPYVHNYIWPFLHGYVSSTLDMEWFQTSVVIQQIRHCPGHDSFGYLSEVHNSLDWSCHQDLLCFVPIFVLFPKYSSSASCPEELLLEVCQRFRDRSCWK